MVITLKCSAFRELPAPPTQGVALPGNLKLPEWAEPIGTAQLSGNITLHAALFPHGGGLPIDLGTLGGASAANAINAGGFAVGYSGPFAGQAHATVFMSWAAPIDLGGAKSEARAINRAGDIVGSFGGIAHAALLDERRWNLDTHRS